MGRLYRAGCREKVVLWEFSGSTDDDGRPIVNSPTEIDVRWVPTGRESNDPMASVVDESVRVVVTQDVPINSILWRGELLDLPDSPTDLYLVTSRSHASDIMKRETRRELTLMRYSDTLPELAGT